MTLTAPDLTDLRTNNKNFSSLFSLNSAQKGVEHSIDSLSMLSVRAEPCVQRSSFIAFLMRACDLPKTKDSPLKAFKNLIINLVDRDSTTRLSVCSEITFSIKETSSPGKFFSPCSSHGAYHTISIGGWTT
jgi:hypothetical protein